MRREKKERPQAKPLTGVDVIGMSEAELGMET